MKSFLKTTLLIPFLFATGCNALSTKTIELYLDTANCKDGDIQISFTDLNQYNSSIHDGNNVSFNMNLINKNAKVSEYQIKTTKFIRESNSAEYSVSSLYIEPITLKLECDLKQTVHFTGTLPTTLEEDNYYFTFIGNGKTYRYYLYDAPIEKRKSVTINYYVDGKQQKRAEAIVGKRIEDYDWIGNDYIYGCNEWYSDAELTKKLPKETIIYDDINLYGRSQTILAYSQNDSLKTANVVGYNFIPSTGVIVVPETLSSYRVSAIEASSFPHGCEGLETIYIPLIDRIAYQMNFYNCGDLKTVHFKGTQNQWNAINQALFQSTVEFVFESYI